MGYRNDINGLRAIAVIAVVLFHFNSSWIRGGFAGVDVFFVISGFLMTGIIIKGLEQNNFTILQFYNSRINRIIPALAVLCLFLILFGWFYLAPSDYKALGKHVASSLGFVSNIIYWKEAGYFDAASHEKWLLHTWSLSVEWQFYIIYPLVLVVMRKFMSLATIKKTVLLITILGFSLSVFATYKWPNPSYYLLPTRMWEMMIGGVAFLYPFSLKKEWKKKALEYLGLTMIIGSYFLITKESLWPGYLSLFPVLGSFFIIQAQRNNSLITNNYISQKIGTWSYSIYLWHWPLVVAIHYFSLNKEFIYLGIVLSIVLGFLSNKYIESIKFKNNFDNLKDYLLCKPILIVLTVSFAAVITYIQDGFLKLTPSTYQTLINDAKASPYRDKCHIQNYQAPFHSCEYFEKKIYWATFGDSHSAEIAYALAKKLQLEGIGIKQFSFSACRPSFQEPEDFSYCSRWYNETIEYILNDKEIKNVVFNHRFTKGLLGGDAVNYPEHFNPIITDEVIRMTKQLDKLILLLASNKDNVYIFYPIPELQKNINQLVRAAFRNRSKFNDIKGTDLAWYRERNKYVIDHFDNSNYPPNVHLLKSQDIFCDGQYCYAVRDGIPLYYDSHHPSVLGAEKLINLIK